MKYILQSLLLFSIFSYAQTIEKRCAYFELVVNAKSVTEYYLDNTTAQEFKDFKNIEVLFQKTNKAISFQHSFDSKGYILESIANYTSDSAKTKYDYDDLNKLNKKTIFEKDKENSNYKTYSTTDIIRSGNEAFFKTTYAAKDSIFKETKVLKNDLIVEEKDIYYSSIPTKPTRYSYNEKNLKTSGTITFESGKKLTWSASYEYYTDGVVKLKKEIYTNGSLKTTAYYPNGLVAKITIKAKLAEERKYKYDQKGNWIYAAIYKNGNKIPATLIKRDVVY